MLIEGDLGRLKTDFNKPLNYTDIKKMMERKLAGFKKGLISRDVIDKLLDEYAKECDISHLNEIILANKVESIAQEYEKWYITALGDLPVDQPAGVYQWMSYQLIGASP